MENEGKEEKSKKRKEMEQMAEEMGETPPNKLAKLTTTPSPSNSINNENNNENINNNNNENNLNSTIELSENKIDIETNLLNEKKKWLEVWKEMLRKRRRRAKLANLKGNYYYASEQYDKAIEHYREAIKNNPYNVIINENIAKTYVNIGLYKKAIKHFKKEIVLDKTKEEICYELGTELYSVGEYKQSIGFFRVGLEMYPTHFRSRLNLSLSLEALKKYDEALEQLQIILSQTKDSEIVGNVYTIMGMIHILIDKYEEGMEYVKLAVNMNPSNHNYFNIGKALDNKNKYEEAIEYYKKALEKDPIDIRVRSNLGDLYIKMKRFDDAINQQKISPELDVLLKEKNIDHYVFYIFSDTRIAMALIRKKEFEKANKIILKIFETLKEVPESESDLEVIQEVYFIRGLFHYKTARYQDAIEDLELSSYNYSSDDYVVPPLHHEVNYYYAMSLMKLGNDEKSEESKSNYFEKALEKLNQTMEDGKNEKDWSKSYFRKAQLFLFYLFPTNIEQAKINFQIALQNNISLAPSFRLSDHHFSSFQQSLDEAQNSCK